MSFHHNPRIITDGLILNFDAADNKSLPYQDLPVKGQNLVCWYDSSDDDTITYGSASYVSEWKDKSGNGHHLYQNVVANQPNRVNTHNGKYIVDFDGSNDFLRTSSSISIPEGRSVFVVVPSFFTSSFAGMLTINDSFNSGIVSDNYTFELYWGDGSRPSQYIYVNPSGSFIISQHWEGPGSDLKIMYKNGVYDSGTGTLNNTDTTGALGLGYHTNYYTGSIAEVIIYDKLLDTYNINLIHTYLQNKWNITSYGTIWNNRVNSSINGTLRDGPTRVNNYLSFDGVANRITVEPSSDIFTWKPSSATNTSITIECWVKTSDTTGYIFSKPFNGGGEYNYSLTPSSLILGTDVGTTAVYTLNFTSIADGTWKHIVVVVDPLYATIYVNGEIHVGPSAHSRNSNDPSGGITDNKLSLMTYYPYTTNPWAGNTAFSIDGDMAVFRFYNTALTSDNVLQNYRTHKHRFGL